MINSDAVRTGGFLNRSVRLCVGPGGARGIVRDDFHHFRVAIRHHRGIVRSVETQTLRGPYSLCGDAGGMLQSLEGLPLPTRVTDLFQRIDGRLQCTHQFDLAALTAAAAMRGADRSYDVQVSDPVDGRRTATVVRDGVAVLVWNVANYAVASPAPYAGHGLGQGFTDWAATNLDDDEAEAALVLRRGVFISRGRQMLPELNARAHAPAQGGCWVQQPERAHLARRLTDTARDYSPVGISASSEDVEWLDAVRAQV